MMVISKLSEELKSEIAISFDVPEPALTKCETDSLYSPGSSIRLCLASPGTLTPILSRTILLDWSAGSSSIDGDAKAGQNPLPFPDQLATSSIGVGVATEKLMFKDEDPIDAIDSNTPDASEAGAAEASTVDIMVT